jgi:hypothetical protein
MKKRKKEKKKKGKKEKRKKSMLPKTNDFPESNEALQPGTNKKGSRAL